MTNFIKGISQFLLILILVWVTSFSISCTKESSGFLGVDTLNINSAKGVGRFMISFQNTGFTDTIPLRCKFSVKDKSRTVIFEDSSVNLTNPNTNIFNSVPVNLYSGYYYLEACDVFDDDNNLLYCRLEQSGTIEFKIEKDKNTMINPSLSPVYPDIVQIDSFFVYAYYYDVDLQKYIKTSATVSFSNNGAAFYTGTLQASVNAFPIAHDLGYFIINVIKPDFVPYRDSLNITELSLYKRIYPYTAFLEQ